VTEVLTFDDELEGDDAAQWAQGHLTLVDTGVRVRQVLEGGHLVCLEESVILERYREPHAGDVRGRDSVNKVKQVETQCDEAQGQEVEARREDAI
jgi:hypothetical protein